MAETNNRLNMTPRQELNRRFHVAATVLSGALLFCLLIAPSANAAKQETIVFIDAGKPSQMKVIGKPWTAKKGQIECEGSGDRKDRLVMGHSIGPGDFHIKARLTISDLDRSAASFRFGMDNSAIFGFEGAHDAMYVAGKFFKTNPHSGKIGDPSKFIQDGEPFDLELIREGDQLRILIDGKLVRKQTVLPGGLGPAGFVPVRSTMGVEHFSVTANFTPFAMIQRPSHIDQVARITMHPLVTEIPDLKLGPFVRLSDGSLLTAEEKSAFISTDEGDSWKEIPIFAKKEPFRIKPERVLMCLKSGTILLVMNNWAVEKLSWNYKTQRPNPDMHRPTYVLRSFDEGKTWTKPQLVYDGYCGALRDAIQLKNGTVVIMGQELIFDEGRNSARAYVSVDDGATWKKSPLLDMGGEQGDHSGTIEGTLVELEDGRLWTLLRTYRGWFYEAFSEDQGLTWSPRPPVRSKIRSTGSPGMLTRLSDGRLVLFWNAIPNEGFVRREELSVAFSSDDGQTWTKPLVIARNPTGRVSYPYVFEAEPRVLWVTTMQGNFRGSMKVDDLYDAAISQRRAPEFRRSTKHFKEYLPLPVKDVK